MLDLDQARTRLNAELRKKRLGAVDDPLWSTLLSCVPPHGYDTEDNDEEYELDAFVGDLLRLALFDELRGPRGRAAEARRPARRRAEQARYAPSWWWSERELFMRRFGALQDEVLEMLGRKDGEERRFLQVEEISDYVEAVAAQESSSGEPSFLWVPLAPDPEVNWLPYRMKVVYDGFDRWVDYYENDYRLTSEDWAKMQGQRLARLASAARSVAKATGCLKEEATAFLLADYTPFFVPFSAVVDEHSGGITLHVRHPQVSVRDVTRALSDLRWEAFGGSGLAPKGRHSWGTVVFEFVELCREEWGSPHWPLCYAAFLRSQKEKPPYRNMRSFRQAYYAEHARRERVRREAERVGSPSTR